jgi:uncharacterized membrane protein
MEQKKRMDNYLLLKYLHIFCAFMLAGTGLGIAFFMLMASRSKNISVIAHTARMVVLADWIFTTPAVVGQLVTGVLIMRLLYYSFSAPWFFSVISLFIFIGCCWLPVVIIQLKLKKIAVDAEITGHLDKQFYSLMKIWIALGIPAFCGILLMLWLMIYKPLAII